MENKDAREFPIIVGLFYGDEGKGTTVDFLCSQAPVDYVVRFSGGPQTAHNVVTADGREHTFSQFGSGTFQGAGTLISQYMLVNPFNMVVEANDLHRLTGKDPFVDTYISESALMITPLHVDANQQREINRGKDAHGSCGEGIGETRAYALYETPDDPIRIGDMENPEILRAKMAALKIYLEKDIPGFKYAHDIEETIDGYRRLLNERPFRIMSDAFISELLVNEKLNFVFEGSQGILLDESFGFHPHTTWSDVTSAKAYELIRQAGLSASVGKTIGITRTYATRHGFGPFPSEFPTHFDWAEFYPEKHNDWGRFQGSWRAGELDVSLLEYAVKVNGGIHAIALTHCDIPPVQVVMGWEHDIVPVAVKDLEYQESLTNMLNRLNVPVVKILNERDPLADMIAILQERLNAPVEILSYGPKAQDKKQL